MFVEMCKAKIHRVTVTDADLNYEGSITLDPDLMDAAGILRHEKVQVLNISNGERLETYVIEGERGTGTVCLNGAAARLVSKGDLAIVVAYCVMDEKEAMNHTPRIVLVDKDNRPLPAR